MLICTEQAILTFFFSFSFFFFHYLTLEVWLIPGTQFFPCSYRRGSTFFSFPPLSFFFCFHYLTLEVWLIITILNFFVSLSWRGCTYILYFVVVYFPLSYLWESGSFWELYFCHFLRCLSNFQARVNNFYGVQ